MKITEVRIKLMASSEDRLRGFCSITFDDCFVVRDLKIISGNSGPFVAMPSRKLSSHCGKCGSKNHLKASYCNNCGSKQRSDQVGVDGEGRSKLYADIAHPINAECREMIQARVIEEFEKELELSKSPGYRSRYDDSYDPSLDRSSHSKSAASTRVDKPSQKAGMHTNQRAADPASGPKSENPKDPGFGNGILD